MAIRWVSPAGRPRPRLEARAWLRSVVRPGPEAWVWLVAGVAWLVLLGLGWRSAGHASSPGHHAGMTHARPGADPGLVGSVAQHLLTWVVMVAATMLPLIAWNLRGIGLRSPAPRRTRATVEVAAGWALVWLAGGALLTAFVVLVDSAASVASTVAVVCALALGWQFLPVKRVALARCHRRFAPPLGPAAGAACLRFGRSLGRDCVLSCWPGMTVMMVAGHHPVVVVALAWLSWRDRRRPHDRPGTLVSVLVLLGTCVFTWMSRR